ncbi:hypothetical protein Dimus_022071 [Dionaea muscipula]
MGRLFMSLLPCVLFYFVYAVHHVTYAAIPREDPAKFPPGKGDPPKMYKPYIHYTKLEFKVWKFY